MIDIGDANEDLVWIGVGKERWRMKQWVLSVVLLYVGLSSCSEQQKVSNHPSTQSVHASCSVDESQWITLRWTGLGEGCTSRQFAFRNAAFPGHG